MVKRFFAFKTTRETYISDIQFLLTRCCVASYEETAFKYKECYKNEQNIIY